MIFLLLIPISLLLFLIVILTPYASGKYKNEKLQKEYYKRKYEMEKNKKYSNYNITNNKVIEIPNIPNNNQLNINYSKFYKKEYVMTRTELIFYRNLKKITDKLQLTIFPQVDLERIINVYNNESSYRNRIKSRSIDFTIVNNYNCKIICCIELDDYTHNRADRQERDLFINELFQNVGLRLYRIKASNYYNAEEIEKYIKVMI